MIILKKIFLAVIFSIFFTTNCNAAYFDAKMTEPKENYALRYSDENLIFSFHLPHKDPAQIIVSIFNKTNKGIMLDFDKASIILKTRAYKILLGSQLGANNLYSSSIVEIPPHSNFSDTIFIENFVAYIEAQPVVVRGGLGRRYYSGWGIGTGDILVGGHSGGYKVKPFFPTSMKELQEKNYLNYPFAFYLPANIDTTKKDYRFDFEIFSISKDSSGFLGITVSDNEELLAMKRAISLEKGLFIKKVISKSPADKNGILEKDILIALDNNIINSIEDFAIFMNNKKAGNSVKITYLRNEKKYSTTIVLDKYK